MTIKKREFEKFAYEFTRDVIHFIAIHKATSITNLIKAITTEINHCFQLSLTVEVNFPMNSMIMTCKRNVRMENTHVNINYWQKNNRKCSNKLEKLRSSPVERVLLLLSPWKDGFLWFHQKYLFHLVSGH